MHTRVSAVQFFGHFDRWPDETIYVGMPGAPSRAFGIPDRVATYGKPWDCLNHPLGWQTGYLRYLVQRMLDDPEFMRAVGDLHGMTLLCWCAKKDAPHCHAVILAEFAEMLHHGG